MREIGFQDADFPHRFAWCTSPLEGRSLRWIPYGMPRLNDRFKHMAFFLYAKNPDPKKGPIGPLGTGFFVGLEGSGGWYLTHTYAVTCKHVAVKSGASILRINTKDGGHRFIELEPHEWEFIRGGDDACAIDVTDRLTEQDEYSVVLPSMIATKDFIANDYVEIGEDGFMLGLFADHSGTKQNLIAARFGNLSLLAHDDEPIEQPHRIKRPSHIFDMRSRPGFSGSPVFVYRTPAGDLRAAAERGRDKSFERSRRREGRYSFVGPGGDFGGELVDRSYMFDAQDDWYDRENTFLMLLGLHAGQYPEQVEARKVRKTHGESDDIVRDRDKLKIPGSMAVVVPAWEVINLLNLSVFADQRRERDERVRMEREKKNLPEPEVAEKPEAADDANPNHLADFRRLVDVAARKRRQDDQT
jgi:hypothetical protein